MTEHQTYGIRAPEGTIVVSPQQDAKIVYDRTTGGEELLGILIQDHRTGPLLVAMSLSMAALVAEHLQVTLDNIDVCRADWDRKNGDHHE